MAFLILFRKSKYLLLPNGSGKIRAQKVIGHNLNGNRKSGPRKGRRITFRRLSMKKVWKSAAAILLAAAMVSGCSSAPAEQNSSASSGE